MGRSLLRPIVLPSTWRSNMMRVQVVPPDWANTCPVILSYCGLVRSHQVFGGSFTSSVL